MERMITVVAAAGALAACGSDSGGERVRCDDLACVGGSCAGESFATGHAERLRADATRLYWIDLGDPGVAGDEQLRAAPLAGGGPVEDLATAETFTRGLRVNAGWVAWGSGAGIHTVGLSPPMTSERLVDTSIQYGFDLDAAAAYYGELTGDRALLRTGLADHATTTLTTGAYPLDVLVRGADVYFTTCSGVSKVATTGGAADALVDDECAVWLAGSADALAWWSFSDSDGYAIRAFDLAARTERVLVRPPEIDGDIFALEADDTDVYFSTEAAICRVPIGGGEPVKVAEGTAFTLAPDAIYWATAAGEILRRAK